MLAKLLSQHTETRMMSVNNVRAKRQQEGARGRWSTRGRRGREGVSMLDGGESDSDSNGGLDPRLHSANNHNVSFWWVFFASASILVWISKSRLGSKLDAACAPGAAANCSLGRRHL